MSGYGGNVFARKKLPLSQFILAFVNVEESGNVDLRTGALRECSIWISSNILRDC